MDYKVYKPNASEIIKAVTIYVCVAAAAAYFFYRSYKVFLIMLPGFALFYRFYVKMLGARRLKKLKEEFAEMLRAVSAGMNAGYSMENAFLEARKDMEMFYGKESMMAGEIIKIRKGLEVNMTLEELIKDIAVRSGDEDIAAFSDVLGCAKRYGGNVTEVLGTAAETIRGKICVDKEIELIIAEKKLELRMMEVLPFFILMYLRITSVGYFDCLYSGITGRVFMTVCLVLYVTAAYFAEKIMDIKV
ncbi:MAG: hypothetical protein K6E19_11090 [Lachnospiraceae bacterium]|nr:hypothetical protein [Lachnospiraceae bacterium]